MEVSYYINMVRILRLRFKDPSHPELMTRPSQASQVVLSFPEQGITANVLTKILVPESPMSLVWLHVFAHSACGLFVPVPASKKPSPIMPRIS